MRHPKAQQTAKNKLQNFIQINLENNTESYEKYYKN